MKTIITIILLVLSASVTMAQFKGQYYKGGRALTTAWTKITPGQTIYMPEVFNDTTAGNDSLWVAFRIDTSATGRFPIKAGKSMVFNVVADTIWIKATGSSLPYRLRGSK